MDYNTIKNWSFEPVQQTFSIEDTILYHLAIGFGCSHDSEDLCYLYEEDMSAFPTLALVLASPGLWMRNPDTGIEYNRVVHGEQRLWLHDALPVEGEVYSKSHISHVIDKGSEKGALIIMERKLYAADDRLLATMAQTNFCRGDGGLSASDPAPEKLTSPPERSADMVLSLATSPRAAMIYRLTGDVNPLHIDPAIAQKAGFKRPILHGLSTFAHAARAVVNACASGQSARLKEFHTRFSAPFYPGETLQCSIWSEGEAFAFRAKSKERDVTVLDSGRAVFEA